MSQNVSSSNHGIVHTSRVDSPWLVLNAQVRVECNSGYCTEIENCDFSGKTGTLVEINKHNTDGDFYGVKFSHDPNIIYFWQHELSPPVQEEVSSGDY